MNIRLEQVLWWENQHGTMKGHRTLRDVENWDVAGIRGAFLEGHNSGEAGKRSRGHEEFRVPR